MKKLTSVIVAAALIAPSMAAAQRVTTPGTADRHAANLAKADDKKAAKEAKRDTKAQRVAERRVPAAKAGRVNLAAPAVGSPN